MTQVLKTLRALLRLPVADQLALVQALFVVCLIRLVLWFLPLRSVRQIVSRLTRRSRAATPQSGAAVTRIVWAVSTARRVVPAATCLSQALAAQVMLTRSGHRVQLRIGVAKAQSGTLEAHAWLENQGVVIFGNLAGFSRFTALPPLEAAGS